jgi:hypothetical protein
MGYKNNLPNASHFQKLYGGKGVTTQIPHMGFPKDAMGRRVTK